MPELPDPAARDRYRRGEVGEGLTAEARQVLVAEAADERRFDVDCDEERSRRFVERVQASIAAGSGAAPRPAASTRRRPRRRTRRSRPVLPRIAVGLLSAAAVVVAVWLFSSSGSEPGGDPAPPAEGITASEAVPPAGQEAGPGGDRTAERRLADVPVRSTDELRRLQLAGGGELVLAAGSRWREGPEFELLAGRVQCQVSARAPDDPFVVRTERGRVTVLGTRFSVLHADGASWVGVEEGRVAVAPVAGAGARELAAGQALQLSHDGTTPLPQRQAHWPLLAEADAAAGPPLRLRPAEGEERAIEAGVGLRPGAVAFAPAPAALAGPLYTLVCEYRPVAPLGGKERNSLLRHHRWDDDRDGGVYLGGRPHAGVVELAASQILAGGQPVRVAVADPFTATSTGQAAWQRLVVVCDGTELRLYVDGRLVDRQALVALPGPESLDEPLQIGPAPGWLRGVEVHLGAAE